MNITEMQVLSDVPDAKIEYLWHNRVPLGEITIIEGHPGTNKSSLTADLAARLTQGVTMPCSDKPPLDKAGALFLIGEDSIGKTVKARLKAAGADLNQIGVLETISIPNDIHAVEKYIHQIGAKLVVVDTLNDFLNCNVLGNQAVRKALRPLRDLAQRTNVAVILLRHLIKSNAGHSLLRGGGSVGITAVARSQLKLFRHPDDSHMRVLVVDKNNLGPLSPSLLFEIAPSGDSIRLEWQGETPLTIADLETMGQHPKLDAAEKLLLEKLASGPKEVNLLIDAAKGICSKRTLDEAKRSLDIETSREGKGKGHKVYWRLPSPKATKPDVPKGDDLPEDELDVGPVSVKAQRKPPKPAKSKPLPTQELPEGDSLGAMLVEILKQAAADHRPDLNLVEILEQLLAKDYQPYVTGINLREAVQAGLGELVTKGEVLKSDDRRYIIKPEKAN